MKTAESSESNGGKPEPDAPASTEALSVQPPWWKRVAPIWGIQLLALVPVVSTLLLVRSSPRMQYHDYWTILPRILNPDGGLAQSQLFEYHEGHVLAVPSVIYWLNFKLTSGLNTDLGIFVVALVVAQVVMLRWLLPRASVIGRWTFAAAFVAITSLLFATQGAHNFARAMSGTAWLLANFMAVAAILVATRRPHWSPLAAIPLAILASLSYGTGVMVWAVLVLIALLRRSGPPVTATATAAASIGIGTYAWFYERPLSQASVEFDPSGIGRRTIQVLGSAIAPDPAAAVGLGAAAVVLGGILVVRSRQLGLSQATPWIALLVYSILGATMIGFARGGANGLDVGATSRYFSLSALCWASLLVLAALVLPHNPRVLVGAALVAVLAFVAGDTTKLEIRQEGVYEDQAAIALRQGMSSGYPGFWVTGNDNSLYRAIGHYPFSDDYDLDCGREGTTLDRSEVAQGDIHSGALETFEAPFNEQSVRMVGWAYSDAGPPRCVLIVDGNYEVVGAAGYGLERGDVLRRGLVPSGVFEVGFAGIAVAERNQYRAVMVTEDDQLVELPNVLRGTDAYLAGADAPGSDEVSPP